MKKLLTNVLLLGAFATHAQIKCAICEPGTILVVSGDSAYIRHQPVCDTIHELILVSTSKRGLVHTEMAQAVRKGGVCIKHMDCRGRELKYPVVVWSCESEKRRKWYE